MSELPLVVAVTGASGAVYATRLIDVLVAAGRDVHLTISPAAKIVIHQELGLEVDLDDFDVAQLRVDRERPTAAVVARALAERPARDFVPGGSSAKPGRVPYHHFRDFMAPLASGSFLTGGMVICPCSGSTLSAVVNASGGNLVHRAADVHLKERRKLILVPRETPLSTVQLENYLKASQVGAVVLPAMPGWYHEVESMADLVDFVVARILDQLGVEHALMKRWGTGGGDA